MGLGSLNPGCGCGCCSCTVQHINVCQITWQCEAVQTRVLNSADEVVGSSGASGTFSATTADTFRLQCRSSLDGEWRTVHQWSTTLGCADCGQQLFGDGERLVSVMLDFEGVSSVASGTYSAMADANDLTIPLASGNLDWDIEDGSFVCFGELYFYEVRFLLTPPILSRTETPAGWRLQFTTSMQMRTRTGGGPWSSWNGPLRHIDVTVVGCLASWSEYWEGVDWAIVICSGTLVFEYGSSNVGISMSLT